MAAIFACSFFANDCASNSPRRPHPTSPTEIAELACDPRTVLESSISKPEDAVRRLRRLSGEFMASLLRSIIFLVYDRSKRRRGIATVAPAFRLPLQPVAMR